MLRGDYSIGANVVIGEGVQLGRNALLYPNVTIYPSVIEGHIEGVTGWSIGPATGPPTQSETEDQEDVHELYQKLRTMIVPMFYQDRDQWINVMRQSIAFNASFFNTHRMVQQYAANAYV